MIFSKILAKPASLTSMTVLLVIVAIAVVSSNKALAQEASKDPAQQALSKSDIEKIVRDYLLENPEIMLEVQEALEAKQQSELADAQKTIIDAERENFLSAPYTIKIGNPGAKTTIVEFFDYNCGFCQRALEDMQLMLEADNDIQFVLKEFPVLGEGSLEASRVSMAFSRIMPEKHADYHIRLLGLPGIKDYNSAVELALEMGANESALQKEIENPDIISTIQNTYELANGLGITGTPSYIIGDEVVFGAVGHEQLQEKIQNLEQ